MSEEIIIEPMTEALLLWRCLHDGPLSQETMDQWPDSSSIPWERYRERNTRLFTKLTQTYGACAILARDDDRIVGELHFYPKAVLEMEGAGGLCHMQDLPNGPSDDFFDSDFPPLDQISDKTLVVLCMLTGGSQQQENPYQRRGLASRMVRRLIQWARTAGWERIEAEAFEDIPIIYEITGSAGYTFWEKLGFRVVDRHPHPHLQDRTEFVEILEEQALELGISLERARDQLIMQLDLVEIPAT